MTAEVTRRGVFDMQVCVPTEWTDRQALDFAKKENPSGTESGWHIRKQGSVLLAGDNERVSCEERAGYIHIMLDA